MPEHINHLPMEEKELDEGRIVKVVNNMRQDSLDIRRVRREAQMNTNYDAYLNTQDWSDKLEGQSTEFLPKTSIAVEQFCNFVEKGLTQFGDWFSVDSKTFLREDSIINLINRIYKDAEFELAVTDAVKVGSLTGLLGVKLFGRMSDGVGRGGKTFKSWKLVIEPLDIFNYFPDPEGRGAYEIHRVEKDFYELQDLVEKGIYEVEDLDGIRNSCFIPEYEYEDSKRKNTFSYSRNRKVVTIDEFYGNLMDEKGDLLYKDIQLSVANEKYLIRKPRKFKYNPFVVSPLVRVPFSVWHKSIFDDAVSLNFILNELINLIFDGSIAATWGVKQLRLSDLEDEEQVANGVRQGMTLFVRDGVPRGTKVLEDVSTGKVPTEAFAVAGMIDKEIQGATFTNDIRLGSLAGKPVRATEILKAEEGAGTYFDGVIRRLEIGFLRRILTKSWGLIVDNLGRIDFSLLVDTVGADIALMLASVPDEQRRGELKRGVRFDAVGLSSSFAKVKNFQKLMALAQVVVTNPLMAATFVKEYSSSKYLKKIIKALDINPDEIKLGAGEFNEVMQTGAEGKGLSQENVGDNSLASEINQEIQPTGGLGESQY